MVNKRNPLTKIYVDGVEIGAKWCHKCESIKPLSDFYNHKGCSGGKSPICKKCNGYQGKYSHAKLTTIIVEGDPVTAKDCVTCRLVKPLTDFTKINNKHKKGVGGHYARCKKCEMEYRRELDKRPGVRERRLKRSREYTQIYKVRKRKISRLHRKNNIAMYKTKDANRWARKKLLRDDLSAEQYKGVMAFFGDRCALTGSSDDVTLEHFIPMSLGHGGSYVGNVYPATGSLNYSKSASNPFDWVMREDVKEKVDMYLWDQLITYLAGTNGMGKSEFIEFVNWCFDNPRSIEDLEKDRTDSIELYLSQNE